MSPEGEKQMLELLSEILAALARIEAIADLYKDEDKRRADIAAVLQDHLLP